MVKRFMLVAGALFAWHSTASAGAPAWCKGRDFKTNQYTIRVQPDADVRSTIRNVVEGLCSNDPSIEPMRAQMEKLRAELSKELFMRDADWTDAIEFLDKGWSDSESSIKVTATSIATLTPMDQYVVMTTGFQKPGGYSDGDWLYRIDALESGLTETGRLGFLQLCVDIGQSRRDDDWIVGWAMCAEDIKKFDPWKFADELRSDTTHPVEQRTMLHRRAALVLARIKEQEALREKLFKRDDAYKRLFEIAAQARDEWRKGIGTNRELLSLLQTMESGRWFHSRKQFDGCKEKTEKALADATSKIPASLFKNIFDERDNPFHGFAAKVAPILADRPEFSLAASAYALCHADTNTGAWLGGVVTFTPGFRGPRTAALTAIFHQRFELDDTQLKEVPKPNQWWRPFDSKTVMSFGGVLKAFKPGTGEKKGTTVANLEKTFRMQDECVKEHSTGRISEVLSNGTIHYETVCDKWKTFKRDYTWDPFPVNDQTAKLVKRGNMFSAIGASDNPKAEVIAVWPNKNAKQPSMLLGVTLK